MLLVQDDGGRDHGGGHAAQGRRGLKWWIVDGGPSIYDPPFKTAAALGGVPTSVVPTTIVLDKQHRPATVFLRSITAQDVMDVVDKLEKE